VLVVALIGPLNVTQARADVTFQALLNPDGSGRLFVNDGNEPEWQACAPDLSSCTPFATGGDITTDGAPPGTVFRADATSFSPLWQGDVRSLGPPSVTGAVRANQLVVPVPGEWQGGWADDYDLMQLSACTTPAADDCLALTPNWRQKECQQGAALLDPALTGRYLRVVNRRYAADTAFLLIGYPAYSHEGAVAGGPTTSVAIVDRIARATGPPPKAVKCGGPALNRAVISESGIATVRCALGCRAVLVAERGTKIARVARRLPRRTMPGYPVRSAAAAPTRLLYLSPRMRDRLGPGRLRLRVKIDGLQAARRIARISRPLDEQVPVGQGNSSP
jgi:hypothetical protein